MHTATTRSVDGDRVGCSPVDLQQRMLFPERPWRRQGAPNPNAITVTIAAASGPALRCPCRRSDFYVTLREGDGTIRNGASRARHEVTKTNPLQAHIDLLDRITDTQIHDPSPIWRQRNEGFLGPV